VEKIAAPTILGVPMAIVSFRNLSKSFGRIPALSDLTLDIEPGAVGLLGPNGAGKSTLLKVLLGLVPPTAGEGKVLGLDIRSRRDQLRIRERVGYMPELDCHLPGLSAVQLVSLCGELTGMPRVEAMQRAHEALYYVGLAEERYRPVDGYSTGMRQKAKLAQALVASPDLVFLDEPTNGLDPKGREEMLELIRRIRVEKGTSVILSSHLLRDVERTCERVIVLHEGRVRLEGPIADLVRRTQEMYRVRVAEGREALIAELGREGIESAAAAGDRPDDRDALVVTLPAGRRPLDLFAIARRARAPIRLLERCEESLEDVFFRAVGAPGLHMPGATGEHDPPHPAEPGGGPGKGGGPPLSKPRTVGA
jgi:ABC-2 type transport system ATP-binding protein